MVLQFQPPVIAHRGASAYAPENTLAAFIKAAQLGVKWVEFDVMQAACGKPVIFHDETLNRTTNGQGDIDQYSFNFLHSLDAGSWFNPMYAGEKIPTLKGALEFLQTANMSVNIEIKALAGREDALVRKIAREIGDYQFPILFSSFSIAALEALRQHIPNCHLGLLLHEWTSDWQKTYDSLNCVSVHVNHDILSEYITQQIKSSNKLLLCYTVNDPERAAELFSWGVDAIFSDAPDLIIQTANIAF